VSIGGLASKGVLSKKYLVNLLTWLTGRYQDNKFHMFGVGISGVDAYKQIRPYSCDFSTWSTVARFGNKIAIDKKQIIKEVGMPKEERQRLRDDPEFLSSVTRESIQNIKYYEDTLNSMVDTGFQVPLM